jgi:hypothetical protein
MDVGKLMGWKLMEAIHGISWEPWNRWRFNWI